MQSRAQHENRAAGFKRKIACYDRGMITTHELAHALLEIADESNVPALFPLLPEPVILEIRKLAGEAPSDDAGWARFRLRRWTGDSVEELNTSTYRTSIELVRRHFSNSKSV